MKDLKTFILEASILANIDDQLNDADVVIIKKWLNDNLWKKNEKFFEFDLSTTPITVNYDGHIHFNDDVTSLTNGLFQWGKINGDFAFVDAKISNLDGAPKEVKGKFNCAYCNSLKTLEGAPKIVGGEFNCSKCKSLESLEGAPEEVGGNFDCHDCESLRSLKGAPKEVGGGFSCYNCQSLKSLEGAPKRVGKIFYCNSCGADFTEDDVKKICKVKGKINCLL